MIKTSARFAFLFLLLVLTFPVHAHANLLRSEPGANTALKTTPEAIRLWFSEPLEANFSTIELRDSRGERVPTAKAALAVDDDKQLVLPLDTLTDGFYTVAWRALSKTDGHLTQGSFPIAIGAAYLSNVPTLPKTETIPAESAVIRWLNWLSLALFTGSLGFVLFVWQPTMNRDRKNEVAAPPILRQCIMFGWALTGITTGLLLLMQAMTISGDSLISTMTNPLLLSIMTETRFGALWMIRVGLWLCAGGILFIWQRDTLRDQVLLGLSIGIIATVSLFSHASSLDEPAAAVLADFLHALTMALWVGGLIAFFAVIRYLKTFGVPDPRQPAQGAVPGHSAGSIESLSRLTGYFSNYMRVTVAALMLTGVYAAWLQVGSLNALLTTLYGQTLIVKLILIAPLVLIAAINLFLTHKGLAAGNAIWSRRLRILVTLEIILTVSILGAVGVMTAISPARGVAALRDIPQAAPAPPHFMETQTAEGVNVTLHIVPGWVGENTFALVLTDTDGNQVKNASRVRLQFDYLTEDLGRSELRPEHAAGGIYQIDGANLTVPGDWRVRVIVARPDAYDSVVDFMPLVPPPPAPPAAAPVQLYPEKAFYGAASLVLGIVGIGVSAVFLRQNRGFSGTTFISMVWLVSSALIGLGSLPALLSSVSVTAEQSPFPADTPIKLALATRAELPTLVTQAGKLLVPGDNGAWQAVSSDMSIRNIFIEDSGRIWAATDKGVYTYADNTWEQRTDIPVKHLTLMHGFIFASGDAGMTRTEWGGTFYTRRLEMPTGGAAEELAMLGNHDHILRVENAVFSTPDLGLSWYPLVDAPENIVYISVTGEGNLFASTLDAVYVWDYVDKAWRTLPTPPKMPVTDAKIWDNRLYIIAGGTLYKRQTASWAIVGDEQATYTALAVQYQKGLWALDAANRRLWFTADGTTWDAIPIDS
jgi:copper transport protein